MHVAKRTRHKGRTSSFVLSILLTKTSKALLYSLQRASKERGKNERPRINPSAGEVSWCFRRPEGQPTVKGLDEKRLDFGFRLVDGWSYPPLAPEVRGPLQIKWN